MFSQDEIDSLLQIQPPERTNEVLYKVFSRKFLDYWTFGEPKVKGVELSDVLIIWGDVCFLIEAKTRNSGKPAGESWIRSKIDDSITQINMKYDLLRSGEIEVIRNKWRGEFKWADLNIKHYYGLCVFMHNSDSYEPREIAPESFKKAKCPVQVISLFDLLELIRFVDTIPDFVVYYEIRNCYLRYNYGYVNDELNVYKDITENWAYWVRKCQNPNITDEELEKDTEHRVRVSNVIFNSSYATSADYSEYAAGLLIDLAGYTLVQKADPDISGKRVGSDRHDDLIAATEYIVELSRRRRILYGKIWLELANKCKSDNEAKFEFRKSPSRNRSYVFIVVSSSVENSLDESLIMAHEIFKTHETDSCICLVANVDSIINYYSEFEKNMQRQDSDFEYLDSNFDCSAIVIRKVNK